ncbi:uncharacterized protein [Nicotiana tomentosiformis]|uniref:uncharacterized protein n=1 Tax=Nicotiana tomentosiformis TaxID=4098 RepID=UPI00388C44C3
MTVTTRSGRGGNAPTSSQRQLVDDEQVTDIEDTVEEVQEEVNPSRNHIIDIQEPVVQKAKAPLPKPPPSYPQRLTKKNGKNQFKKFIDMMKSLSINVPLVETLEQMSGYEKFMKDLVTKKRSMNFETIKFTHQVVFHMCKSMRQPNSNKVCSFMNLVIDVIIDDTSAMINVGDMLEAVLVNFDDDEMNGFMECVNSLQGMRSYKYAPRKLSLDLENRKTPPTKPSIEECVPDEEQNVILEACHSSPYGGHHGEARTAAKVLSCDFYWPTIYKDESDMVKRCDECQQAGGISKKSEMLLTTILEIDIFDVWGIDFIDPFVSSRGNT